MGYSKLCYLLLLRIEGLLAVYIGNNKGIFSDEELKNCIDTEMKFIESVAELNSDRI